MRWLKRLCLALGIALVLAAADAGYRVVAFDQRGYSPGARPKGVARYAALDLAGLRRTYEPATREQREEYLAVFSEPGALTAALNWYRAIPASFEILDELTRPVRTSTLFLYGTREGWVTPEYLQSQREFMTGPYEELELDAGHWLMQEQTGAVVASVLAHLRRVDGAASASP